MTKKNPLPIPIDTLSREELAKPDTLRRADPDIHRAANYLANDLFRHNPAVQERVWPAATFLFHDFFAPHPFDHHSVVARIRTKDNTHHVVTRKGNVYFCTCTDTDAPVSDHTRLCRHVLAVKIARLARRQPHPLPLVTPTAWFPWLEETSRRFDIVGALDHNGRYHPYHKPCSRTAVPNEVVKMQDGNTYRLIHDGHRFRLVLHTEGDPIQLDALGRALTNMLDADGHIDQSKRVVTDLKEMPLDDFNDFLFG